MRLSHPLAAAAIALALLALAPMTGCGARAAPPTATNGRVKCWNIVQFNPRAERFPKCIDDPISRDDFVIVTDPTGHEPEVEVSFPDGTHTAGTHTAYARRRCPSGDVQEVKTTYEVLDASHDFVMVRPLPGPSAIPGTTDVRVITAGFLQPRVYRITSTYFHDVKWTEIGSAVLPAGTSFTTTTSTKWGLSATVGADLPKLPYIGQIKISVTGSWESTTTHSLTSPGGAEPYIWRLTHYQGVAQTVTKVHTEVFERGAWIPDPATADSSTPSSNGTTQYGVTYEKKCP